MPSDLTGRHILVTRPNPQGEEMCNRLKALGAAPIYFPTLEIVPTSDPNFKADIARLDQFDWVIFISPQAVMQSAAAIRDAFPLFPDTVKIAAIGQGTALKLQEENFKVAAVPLEDWRTEGLLAMPAFENSLNQKIAIVKGVGGREMLADSLRERGAEVTEIIAYERQLPKTNATILEPYLSDKTLDDIIITSNESLENLETLIDKKYHAYLHSVNVVVMSERIANHAITLGYQKIFTAKNASFDAILHALKGRNVMEDVKHEVKPIKHFPWLGIGFAFSTLAVIVLFALFFYAIVRGSELNQQLARDVTQLQSRTEQLQAHVDTLKKDSLETDDGFKQSIAALQQTLGSNPNSWRVMEAQFYVDLANTKLHFENNTVQAIELLKLADNTIRDLSDPALDNVRRALAQNTATLEALPVVDTTGIYMRLSAINDQIDQLPLQIQAENKEVLQAQQAANQVWWKKGLQESLALLQKVVVVRYNNSNTPALVSPSERDFLFQNVHAMIEKAMWGLLHHSEEVYRTSLQQAIKTINQFYMTNSPATQSVVASLNELQQQNIAPAMPDLSASTAAFHDYFAKGSKA